MEQPVNIAFRSLWESPQKVHLLFGGRGAGRSTAASQFMLSNLMAPEYFRCVMMRYVQGDIRESIYRELMGRIDEQGLRPLLNINETTMTITYGKNSITAKGFKKSSTDQTAKLKSLAEYNVAVIEEADEVPEDDFMKLNDTIRTRKGMNRIVMMMNPPPKTHWIVRRYLELTPAPEPEAKGFSVPSVLPDAAQDVNLIWTNYRSNESNLNPNSVREYEAYRRTRPAHYWNNIMGYIPDVLIGRIYDGWRELPAVPFEAQLIGRGLDFGFSADPSALVAVYEYRGGYIFHEELYRKGMTAVDLAAFISALPFQSVVVCDSSRPEMIAELRRRGVDAVGVKKGAGSLLAGIGIVRSAAVSYTAESVNLRREYENYGWKIDRKNGEASSQPEDGNDHALDAARYMLYNITLNKTGGDVVVAYHEQGTTISTGNSDKPVVQYWE